MFSIRYLHKDVSGRDLCIPVNLTNLQLIDAINDLGIDILPMPYLVKKHSGVLYPHRDGTTILAFAVIGFAWFH